jgi:iron(II)-dependent oxidoreductase
MTRRLQHASAPGGLTREDVIAWYTEMRARTRSLFELITDDAYYERPIALRNPIVFYEGHLPAFAVNTLVKRAHRRDGIDAEFEVLFARGIDPESDGSAKSPTDLWPSRDRVQRYGEDADALVLQALAELPLEDERPHLVRGEAVFTILEHELMHQETLLYLFHALPAAQKNPRPLPRPVRRGPLRKEMVGIPAGTATLGMRRGEAFGWDNEFEQLEVPVCAFEIESHDVTNGEYLEFVEATGADAPHFWQRDGSRWQLRGMFGPGEFAPDAPVWVTHVEAVSYARWRGLRLPTEAEFHRAAYGTPEGRERLQPWGDDPADASRGSFDFTSWEAADAGAFPAGASAWGVHDLIGGGWEWTSSLFAPLPGFTPMPSYPEYSADFFDGVHYVLKGASPVTDRRLIRRSFRNWFRPAYPWVFATFRCVR